LFISNGRFDENNLVNQNHENSKHQKPNFKQIPMNQIQNSKKVKPSPDLPIALSLADWGLQIDASQRQ